MSASAEVLAYGPANIVHTEASKPEAADRPPTPHPSRIATARSTCQVGVISEIGPEEPGRPWLATAHRRLAWRCSPSNDADLALT